MATSHPLSHYIELHLRPDPEVAPTHLLAALYTRLHRALAAQGTTSIAVSFPDYSAERHTLGERLRLPTRLIRAGADGVAVVSAIVSAACPKSAATNLKHQILTAKQQG